MPSTAMITAPKFQQLVAFTEAQNESYRKAKPAQKRVMIAKDVLRAIRARRVRPTTGVYIRSRGLFETNIAYSNPEGSVQDLLPTLPTCEVCAKGAIFACTVLRQNQVENRALANPDAQGLFDDDNLSQHLRGVFSPSQLARIENEFECRRICSKGPYAVMGLQRFRPRRRMEEIMQNIVDHGGTFMPKRALKSQVLPRRLQD